MRYIKVKVHPDYSENKIVQKKEDSFEIWTKAPAENNKANLAVINILAEKLNIKPEKIYIVKGHHISSKILAIRES